MIDAAVMIRLCTTIQASDAAAWAGPLQAAAEEFHILEPHQQAMWLANCCHESSGFKRLVENMNYSAERLAQVWPNRYATDPRAIHKRPNELAHRIGGKPDCVANDVYARRLGNGEPSTGDGWKFRGHYPVQLTGRYNYTKCGEYTGLDMLADPDVHLNDLPAMSRISAWFWWDKGLNQYADQGDFGGVVKVWNGGHIGLEDRIAWHKRAMEALGIA